MKSRGFTPTPPQPGLLRLPLELRGMIFEDIMTDGAFNRKPSISRRLNSSGQKQQDIDLSFVAAYKKLSPLISQCRGLRDDCYEFLGKMVLLIEKNSGAMLYRKGEGYWSKRLLQKVHKLELYMSNNMKLQHEYKYPKYLDFLVEEMPSLSHLELVSIWDRGMSFPRAMSDEPGDSVSREGQERRCKLRFLAFLTQRHPNLNRMILPASAGPTLDCAPSPWCDNHRRYKHFLIAEKSFFGKPGDCKFLWDSLVERTPAVDGWGFKQSQEEVPLHDEVLNASLIRREKWSGLCGSPDSYWIIPASSDRARDDITTSEVVDELSPHFHMLEERGYKSSQEHSRKRWQYRGVDEMIEICYRLPWRQTYVPIAVAAAVKAGGNVDTSEPQRKVAEEVFAMRRRGMAKHKDQYKAMCSEIGWWLDRRRFDIQQENIQEYFTHRDYERVMSELQQEVEIFDCESSETSEDDET